jgi:uncharacterized phage infection (PIP) family protein YhgE
MMDNETLQKLIGHFVELKNKIDGVTAGQEELKNDMKSGQEELKNDMKSGQEELKTAINDFKTELKSAISRTASAL